LQRARGSDVDGDLVDDMQKEIAWVLQSPLHVGNVDVSRDLRIPAICLDVDRKRHFMIPPVHAKLARYSHFGSAIRVDLASDLSRHENDFRKFGAFENFAVHLLIAAAVSAVAAGCVHDDGAADFAARRIEPDGAALGGKRSMNRVRNVAEREFDFRLRRVELNDGFLGPGCGRQNQRGQPGEDREDKRNGESPK
jgi:hypothetical protein